MPYAKRMKRRGKGINWTTEEDKAVLSGRNAEGKTPQQNADRRYKLRKFYGASVARLAATLDGRLKFLQQTGRLPKFVDDAFLEKLKRISAEVQ